jgi:hypothetical protein
MDMLVDVFKPGVYHPLPMQMCDIQALAEF